MPGPGCLPTRVEGNRWNNRLRASATFYLLCRLRPRSTVFAFFQRDASAREHETAIRIVGRPDAGHGIEGGQS
jgi:hypothetical protein